MAEKIPDYLIREIIDGISFYYGDYREMMKLEEEGKFSLGDFFRVIVKNGIHGIIRPQIDEAAYWLWIGEGGLEIDTRNILALPIVVFDRKILTPDKITDKYADVPPKIVIEMDINAALPGSEMELFSHFVLRKVRRLIAFGTEKVVWIFSKSKLVLVASSNEPMQILDWNEDVELFDGIKFNVAKYLEEEGINPDAD